MIDRSFAYRNLLKFITRYLKKPDVCSGLGKLYESGEQDVWNQVLLASEVHQAQCYNLWYVTVHSKLNEFTKWAADNICFENFKYPSEYLYPSMDPEFPGSVLIGKPGNSSIHRNSWLLIPDYHTDFTYKIYNRGIKGYLNVDSVVKDKYSRQVFVSNNTAQLWKLQSLSENFVKILNVEHSEFLYGSLNNNTLIDNGRPVFTWSSNAELGPNAVWRLAYYSS